MITIGGFQPLSLSDYPGIPAAVIFLQGCNWRCSYCHNPSLFAVTSQSAYDPQEIITLLHQRKRLLQGVVVTGGEPTLQAGLPAFLQNLRETGLQIKLDSNGTNPELLQYVITERLVDFIAMDIKAPWDDYETIVRRPVNLDDLQKSVQLIANSSLPHQFRTTFPPHLLSEDDLGIIRSQLPEHSPHTVQEFKPVATVH